MTTPMYTGSKKKVVVLTGSEPRHIFFCNMFLTEACLDVIKVYQECDAKSLRKRYSKTEFSKEMRMHVKARETIEQDFFRSYLTTPEDEKVRRITKGSINDEKIVREIIDLNPDILVCYGSSLIKGPLLEKFAGRFLNVHLGLSPYYLGSGTNIWPLIEGKPQYVGATFMHIDSGIDTGAILHQITARFEYFDTPHTVGNRLIYDMALEYVKLVKAFHSAIPSEAPNIKPSARVYKISDFDHDACLELYRKFENGLVSRYIECPDEYPKPKLVKFEGLT